MYIKILVVSLAIASLLVFPQRLKADDPVIKVLTLDDRLEQVFGDKAHLMKAIAMAESNLEERQVSRNYRKDGTVWSVDCGVLQLNRKGTKCPPHLLTIEGNLIEAKKILDEQGLRAWVVWKRGYYKRYM